MMHMDEAELLQKLDAGEPFSATLETGAFDIIIEAPTIPYICTAIHDGHRFRESLIPYCALTENERFYEEDPHTGDIISGFPNRIICHDSRYEYDINRSPEGCIYDQAWGKTVWTQPLPEAERNISLAKYRQFYRVLQATISMLHKKNGGCIVYDIHTYNGKRQQHLGAPTFNVGTTPIDLRRHRRSVELLLRKLNDIAITGETVTAVSDRVFQGHGYMVNALKALSPGILCIPLEIKKFFMEEEENILYPQVYAELKSAFTQAITSHAAFFARTKLKSQSIKRSQMLSPTIDPNVKRIDRSLYSIARVLDPLLYINPLNLEQERKAFFAHNGRHDPKFRYRHLDINPFQIKEALYRLPIETISDVTLQTLYRKAIEGLSTKVDLIAAIGSQDCLYNSLRYYGEPRHEDIENARFLIHAPQPDDEVQDGEPLSDTEVVSIIQREIDRYGIDAPAKLSRSIVAGAMVDNKSFAVLVKRGNSQTRRGVEALKHHEVGVHLLSSANARYQQLQLFRLGLPGGTETQEGTAVLCEYLSGNLSLSRLKTLALRVLAVKHMLDGYPFARTFDALREEQGATDALAFLTTARVYRGGGFTKDYLYLRGLAEAYEHWKAGKSWEPLMIGKVSFENHGAITELIDRGIVQTPRQICRVLQSPAETHAIHDYLLSAMKFRNLHG